MRLSDPKVAKEIIVWVGLAAILIVILTCSFQVQAGGGGGEATTKPAKVEPVEPIQHTEEVEPVHTDLPGHDTPHIEWDWSHVESWKVFTGLGGGFLTLCAAVFGGICAVKAARAKKEAK